jgi:putative effector of murein hydrolase LrgA (UPF0299 family)
MDLKLATIVSVIAVGFVVLIGVLGYLMDKSAEPGEKKENRR